MEILLQLVFAVAIVLCTAAQWKILDAFGRNRDKRIEQSDDMVARGLLALSHRADHHVERIVALERRLAALEKKDGA